MCRLRDLHHGALSAQICDLHVFQTAADAFYAVALGRNMNQGPAMAQGPRWRAAFPSLAAIRAEDPQPDFLLARMPRAA